MIDLVPSAGIAAAVPSIVHGIPFVEDPCVCPEDMFKGGHPDAFSEVDHHPFSCIPHEVRSIGCTMFVALCCPAYGTRCWGRKIRPVVEEKVGIMISDHGAGNHADAYPIRVLEGGRGSSVPWEADWGGCRGIFIDAGVQVLPHSTGHRL